MSAFDISEPSGKLTPSLLQQQAASDDGLLDRHSSRSPTIDLETTTPTTVGEHTHHMNPQQRQRYKLKNLIEALRDLQQTGMRLRGQLGQLSGLCTRLTSSGEMSMEEDASSQLQVLQTNLSQWQIKRNPAMTELRGDCTSEQNRISISGPL
ncbi:hypothetical protein I317_00611 [Kwoniella heveanensis CBS 569]|nr:hypothetical protein I317_00611 [Kwoniella heveanensis CBS 569]